MPSPQTVEAYTAQHITAHVDAIAASLEHVAASIRQIAANPTTGQYAEVAAQVQRKVLASLGYLNLDHLTTLAMEAETAHLRGE